MPSQKVLGYPVGRKKSAILSVGLSNVYKLYLLYRQKSQRDMFILEAMVLKIVTCPALVATL